METVNLSTVARETGYDIDAAAGDNAGEQELIATLVDTTAECGDAGRFTVRCGERGGARSANS